MRNSSFWQLVTVSALVAMGPACGPEADPAQEQSGVDPQIASVRAFAQKHRGVMPKRAPGQAATAASAKLQYYGGHVVSNIKVVPVLWGSSGIDSSITGGIQGFYESVTNSAYWTWLSEYNTTIKAVGGGTGTNQIIGPGSAASPVQIKPSAPVSGSVDDSAIQSELTAQINAGKLPKPDSNTYYAIFFPKGLTITQGGSSSCVGGGFCAYHGTVAAAGSLGEFYYGVHPDMSPGSGCDSGCGSAPTLFQNETSVASHELVETTTDAEVGLAQSNGPPLAWYDTTNGEIGDICNAQQGTIGSYTVQAEWSNKAGACIVTSGACTPSCSGKQCGSDGCGGTCGTCPSGESCDASGQCTTSCTPSCSGKQCGSDGCGGTCGTCPSGESCSSSGQCTTSCTPSCSGKQCGSDGCGGTCGTCPSGDSCSSAGQCISSGGSCAHSECSSGKKLKSGCDACVTQICAADSYCCSTTWDSVCVEEAGTICGESC